MEQILVYGDSLTEIPVVCLQNGVESARIALRRFDQVAGAITMLPSVYLHAGTSRAR